MMSSPNSPYHENAKNIPLTISLKTLAKRLDAHRTSVRRWLREAGIRPVTFSKERNSSIRYRWCDIEAWLDSLEQVD